MAQDNRTEKATPKRRRDQRKEGKAAQSTDVVMVGSLLIVFLGLKIFGPYCCGALARYFVNVAENLGEIGQRGLEGAPDILVKALLVFCVAALPTVVLAAISGILLTGVQTKFLFSHKAFAFKFSNINPLSGLKRMFSLKSLAKLVVVIVKIIIVGAVLYRGYKNSALSFAKLIDTDVGTSVSFIAKEIFKTAFNLCLALVGMAAIDYFYNWWTFEKSIMMTKQEVKEEYKQLEGDPQIKGQIRRRQRQIAQGRMMQMVPKADVVIRNPTHVAVALKYESGKDQAPRVIAKGLDSLALKIIETAEKSEVPIVENRPLARELYARVKLNKLIPASLFREVAEILVWVYELQKNKKERA